MVKDGKVPQSKEDLIELAQQELLEKDAKKPAPESSLTLAEINTQTLGEQIQASKPDFFKPVREMFNPSKKNVLPSRNPFIELKLEDKHIVLAEVCGEDLWKKILMLSACTNVEPISLVQQATEFCFERGTFDAAGVTDTRPEAREARKRTGNDERHEIPDNLKLQMILGPQYLRLVDHARGYGMSNHSAFVNGCLHAIAAGDFAGSGDFNGAFED